MDTLILCIDLNMQVVRMPATDLSHIILYCMEYSFILSLVFEWMYFFSVIVAIPLELFTIMYNGTLHRCVHSPCTMQSV